MITYQVFEAGKSIGEVTKVTCGPIGSGYTMWRATSFVSRGGGQFNTAERAEEHLRQIAANTGR